MQEYLLLGCSPVNNKKGTEAVLYLYNGTEIKICNIHRPHIFCTKRISYDDATGLQNYLIKKFSSRPDVRIKKFQSGSSKYFVVQAIGPRELKKELPELFIKTSNVSELLDWAFPTFSKVLIENDKVEVIGQASLEETLKLPILAIDLELDKKGTQKYIRINTAALAGENYESVFSIFDTKKRSQKNLIAQVEKYIREKDPVIICSHNVAFDLLQPKEKVGAFCIGVDGSSPVIKGGVGLKTKKGKNGEKERKGFPKVEVAGRQLFCSMSFARNSLWCSNNKLPTVANSLGIKYEKDLSYGELEELVQQAEDDISARERIKTYCGGDCTAHKKLAKRLLPTTLREQLAFETDLMSACFTSKAALARKLRDKRYFENLATYRKDRTLELQEFDVYAEKTRLMKSSLDLETERGYFKEPLIAVFPRFLELGFFDLLSRERAAAMLRQGIAKSQSTIDKVVFRRDLEALCEEPLFDLDDYKHTTDKDKMKAVFLGRYKADPDIIEQKLSAAMKDFVNLLKTAKVKPVNYSNRFLFLRPTENLEQSLQILRSSKLVDVYATTNAVMSGSGGRILASIDGIAITSQLDIYGRRGLRTDFEREIYSYLLDFITGELARPELFAKLKHRFADLAQGKVSKVDLVYHIEAEFEPWEYSWPAQKTDRVKALKELGARQGDKFVFGYGTGPDGKPRRYEIEEFLKNNTKPNIPKYQKKFFGEEAKRGGRNFPDGSISDLIYSICPAHSTSERVELGQFFKGTANLARWGVYSNNEQAKLF